MFAFDSRNLTGSVRFKTYRMNTISEKEFARICEGIAEDKDLIVRHNPVGSEAEILLWMLLNCLSSYLSLQDIEMPCFTGVPDENTYTEAIKFVLRERTEGDFDPDKYIDKLRNK